MSTAFGATAYVSYARKDEQRAQVVSRLHQDFANEWVHLKVDANEVRPRESFDDFIKEIGKADCVVVMFSESYLSSFYCMLELTRIMQHGDVQNRVYPVFAEDNFRIDGSYQYWENRWKEIFSRWHEQDHDEPEEIADAYGSVDECKEILDNLNVVFDTFARRLAGQVPTCNDRIIAWVKQTYFKHIKENPAFTKSINHLKNCGKTTKDILWPLLDKQLRECPHEAIAYLVQLPIPDLIQLIHEARCKVSQQISDVTLAAPLLRDLSNLLQYLLPLLFSPAYVKKLRGQCHDTLGVIEIPYSTKISAEVLMAGVDQRATHFYYREMSNISNKLQIYPGRFNLKLPPESGIDSGTQSEKDMEDDLFQRMGTDTKIENICDAVDRHLFTNFAFKQSERNYTHEQKRILTQDALQGRKQDGEPGLYWILFMDEQASQQRWKKLSEQMCKYYPEISLLSLTSDFTKERDENSLFRLLNQIVPY